MRYLIPVKQVEHVEAALAYVLAHGDARRARLMFLHVTPPKGDQWNGHAERLLAAVDARCREAALVCDSYILAGELVFSILDMAELLACDLIVIACLRRRGWRQYFLNDTASRLARGSRNIPTLRIDGSGLPLAATAGRRPSPAWQPLAARTALSENK